MSINLTALGSCKVTTANRQSYPKEKWKIKPIKDVLLRPPCKNVGIQAVSLETELLRNKGKKGEKIPKSL